MFIGVIGTYRALAIGATVTQDYYQQRLRQQGLVKQQTFGVALQIVVSGNRTKAVRQQCVGLFPLVAMIGKEPEC